VPSASCGSVAEVTGVSVGGTTTPPFASATLQRE
jgi:hypothetical protein